MCDILDERDVQRLIDEIKKIPNLVADRVREFYRHAERICGSVILACHDILIMALDVCFTRLGLEGDREAEQKRAEAVSHISSQYVRA